MKHRSLRFFKLLLLVIALVVVAGLLWFPNTEGRAQNLDLVSIYSDPLIIYVYLSSIVFFVGIYQAYRYLSLIEVNKGRTRVAYNMLNMIKVASFSLIGLIAVALLFIRFFAHGDDPAGPTMLGFLVSLVLGAVAFTAASLQKQFYSKKNVSRS